MFFAFSISIQLQTSEHGVYVSFCFAMSSIRIIYLIVDNLLCCVGWYVCVCERVQLINDGSQWMLLHTIYIIITIIILLYGRCATLNIKNWTISVGTVFKLYFCYIIDLLFCIKCCNFPPSELFLSEYIEIEKYNKFLLHFE